MEEQKIIAKIAQPIVFETLIRHPTEEEQAEAANLPFIDLDLH